MWHCYVPYRTSLYFQTLTWFHHLKTICSQWKRSKRYTVQQKIIWWWFKLDYQNLKNRQQHACPTTNLQNRQHSRNTVMLLMFLSLAYIFSSNRLMLLHDVLPKKRLFFSRFTRIKQRSKNGEQMDCCVLSTNICILWSYTAVCASCLEQQDPDQIITPIT